MFGRDKKPKEPDSDASAKEKSDFEQSLDWETSRIEQIEKSERRAHRDKYIAFALVGLLVIGFVVLLPLKQRTPYLIQEDTQTGAVNVVGSLDVQKIPYLEARDKHWVAEYVRARESYDWHTLQKDYDEVGLLSTHNVGKVYADQFEGDDALDKKYGDRIQATVRILSVIINDPGTATVRFAKTTRNVNAGDGSTTTWVATVGYEYQGIDRLSASERIENPFGFQVVSYQVNPELSGGEQ